MTSRVLSQREKFPSATACAQLGVHIHVHMSGHFQSWDSTEDDNVVTLLADEAQKNLKVFCPLCNQIYQDPYITSCGHTFCRRCGSTGSEVCPLDSTKLSLLVRNLAVAEEVGELLIHCRYGCRATEHPGSSEVDPSGCPVRIKLGKRLEHEQECGFAPVFCPNSSLCGKMLRSEFQHHKKTCQYQCCPHYKYNCRFEGSAEAIEEHLKSCKYEGVKVWSLETLEVAHVLKCKGASVYSLAVTGKHIICGTYENTIQVWDVRTLQDKGILTGHVGAVYALAVLKTPGRERLFSASYDKTIRVWNLELMMCAQTLVRHTGSVTCLLASGGQIFSGALDNVIKLWQ